MNPNLQLSNKTKAYLWRVILSGVLALLVGMAGAGQTQQAAAEGLAQGETGIPLVGDVRIAPDLGIVSEQSAVGSNAPGYNDTSVFMTGSVAVGVILPESSSGTENWTTTKVNNVKTQIQNGMNWWTNQYAAYSGTGSLNFAYDWHTPYDGTASVVVSSEPINNSSLKDYQWANEILGRWGYTQSNTQSSNPDVNGLNTMYLRSLAYINDLRIQMGTDWAFVIFVVDSEKDVDGTFTDGYFAYAYLYGPMMVMTYDNANWGIANMYKVAAHEGGHIFGAGDQYYQAGYGGCTSQTQKYGYLGVANSNCDNPTATGISSIMKSNTLVLDATARNQVGWRDSDSDGIFDPLDTPPNFNLNTYTPNPTTNTNLAYSGTAYIQPWPHAVCSALDNCYTQDITTQKLTVDYSVDGSPWQGANAVDGSFSSDYEDFIFATGYVPHGIHEVVVRSQTSQGAILATWSDTVTTLAPAAPATNDDFPGTTISTIPFNDLNVDTTGATTDTDPAGDGFVDPTLILGSGDCNSNEGEASVWYSYTPEADIYLYIDTLGSNYDTLVAVWNGNPNDLTLVACNDDIALYEIQSKVSFYAQAGITYFIEVIGYAGPAVEAQTETRTLNFNLNYGMMGSSWYGGVSIESDQTLVAVGRPHVGSEIMTYDGFSTGSQTAYVPMLFKDAFGGSYDSALYIENLSLTNIANITIDFYNNTGVKIHSMADTVSALASKGYWLPSIAGLGPSWVGGVVIESDQDIVAVGRPHIGSQVTTYNGFSSGSLSAYVPMLFKDAFGGSYDSALYVQNVDPSNTANITIRFYDSSGVQTHSMTDTVLPLASKGYWLPSIAGLGSSWVGGVKVESDRDIVAVGRPHIGSQVMTYNSFSGGNLNSYIPMLFKKMWGTYDSAFYIQNLNNTNTANVSLKFYDSSGYLSCVRNDTIAPLSSRGYWLPTLTCSP